MRSTDKIKALTVCITNRICEVQKQSKKISMRIRIRVILTLKITEALGQVDYTSDVEPS